MRKVVNGKIYDTSKSEYICKHYDGYDHNQTDYEENLYISPMKQYFIAARGSCYSKYPNCSDSDPGYIILLSDNEAKDFIENYGSVDDYIEYFEAEEG